MVSCVCVVGLCGGGGCSHRGVDIYCCCVFAQHVVSLCLCTMVSSDGWAMVVHGGASERDCIDLCVRTMMMKKEATAAAVLFGAV